MVSEQEVDTESESSEAEDELELARARLEWAKASSRCLDIPAQVSAVQWHAAECDESRGPDADPQPHSSSG